MKTSKKTILLLSAVFIVIGVVITIIGIALGGKPGFSIGSNGIQSASQKESDNFFLKKTPLESFQNIDMEVAYSDIEILPSQDDNYYLEYVLKSENGKPTYQVANNTFTFRQNSTKSFSFDFAIFDSEYLDTHLKLYIPNKQVIDSFHVSSDSGDVSIKQVTMNSMNLELAYGDLALNHIIGNTLNVKMDSGEMEVSNSEVKDVTAENSYGDVTFEHITADAMVLTIDSGDLEINNAKLTTLNSKNAYGDSLLHLADGIETYGCSLTTEYGDIELPTNAAPGSFRDSDSTKSYKTTSDSNKKITIYADSGDIEIG